MPDLTLTRPRLERVQHGAVVAQTAPAAFRVTGSAAVECLQGLLTNDLVKPGESSIVYGAMLTPKGMIVVDYWALRRPDGITLLAHPDARAASADLFSKRLPPRLARTADITDEVRAAWLVGPQSAQTLARSGLAGLPDAPGRVTQVDTPAGPSLVALAPEGAPFVAVAVGHADAVQYLAAAFEAGGAAAGDADDLEAARILSGWPALGAEIDERTLPQEVRYDEIGGVSYTKGCYTGQETVARLHFRGHTNRELRGLIWRDRPGAPTTRQIVSGGREVGLVRSTLTVGPLTLALAQLRREIEPGQTVCVDGNMVTVTLLPFVISATE